MGAGGEEAESRDKDTEFVKRKERAKALCTWETVCVV